MPYVKDVVDDVWEGDIPVLYVPRGGVITLAVDLTCVDSGSFTSEGTTTFDVTSSTTPYHRRAGRHVGDGVSWTGGAARPAGHDRPALT